jgi:N-acetylneuraminic acid mutarotase
MRNRLVFLKMPVAIAVTLVVVVFGRDLVFGQGGKWAVRASIPTPRSNLAAGVVNGIVYAVGGGILGSGSDLSTVEAYDPTTNSWMTKTPMPAPRASFAVGVVNGILYAVGGFGGLDKMEAYDPSTSAWTAKAPMPTPRYWHGVGVVNRTLYAVGGWGAGPTGALETYDSTTNTWTAMAPMPTPRVGLAVGVVNGILYAVGGICCNPGHGSRILGTVEAYDPTSNAWTAKAPMPTPRVHAAIGVISGILYVVGGDSENDKNANGPVEAYDPIRNVWTAKAPMPTNRSRFGVGVANGILYAVGGLSWRRDGIGSSIQVFLDGNTYAFKVVP